MPDDPIDTLITVAGLPGLPLVADGAPTLARHLGAMLGLIARRPDLELNVGDAAAYVDAIAALATLPSAAATRREIDGVEHWRDEDGRWVPVTLIRTAKQLEDGLVRIIATGALSLSLSLSRFKTMSFAEALGLIELIASKHNVTLTGKRGDIYLYSHDREWMVSVTGQDKVTFDPSIAIAQQMLSEWLSAEDASADLKAIVAQAFALDEQKRLRVQEILRLRRYDVQHPKWKAAMDVIAQSMETIGKREYLRVHRRNAAGGYVLVPLDLASVERSAT